MAAGGLPCGPCGEVGVVRCLARDGHEVGEALVDDRLGLPGSTMNPMAIVAMSASARIRAACGTW